MTNSTSSNTTVPTIQVPLTPPVEAARKGRKLSVTFDLSSLPATPNHHNDNDESMGEEEEDYDHQLLSPSSRSSSIDISAQAVPDTILVALLDRDEEMRQLVRRNQAFFSSLKSHLYTQWPRFENTLYCPRQRMSDEDWMDRITKALASVPPLLQQFKDLVGYMPPSQEQDTTDDDNNNSYHPTTMPSPQFMDVDITRIRDYPQRLANFKQAYPQFFINLETSGVVADLSSFVNTLLLAPRSTSLPDDLWEMRIYDHLDKSPDLLAQLKEIIDYELECALDDEQQRPC